MQFIEDDNIPTACTDGKEIRYNPKFIDTLSKDELTGLLVHEVLHVANLHHLRLQTRDPERFNIAADYTINEIITDAGFKLPSGALISAAYRNMSAEDIYSKLPADSKQKPMGQFSKPKAGDPANEAGKMTESAIKEEEQRVKMMVAKAADVARMQGKLPAGLNRMVDEIIQPKQNWREVLSRFMTDRVQADYSWKQPNKRYMPMYLPSIETIQVLGEIVLMVDTSGSIDSKLLSEFTAELADICRYINKPLTVLYVDTQVCKVETFEPEDHVILHPKGGGGTDFRPGFDYIEKQDMQPVCVIYFTDGYCNSFPSEPDYAVLWVVYNNNYFKSPFGETLTIKL